ncbi:MAG: ATP-binding cassette domain-containing protein [Erysipelotrichaceae bacterium]
MLKLDKIKVTFHKNTPDERDALKAVSLTLEDGDFVSVLGTNGAGKSTLLHAICGEVEITSGKILLDDIDITYMDEHKRSRYIGTLFQDPMKGSAPHLTIEENLALAYCHNKYSIFKKGISKKDHDFFYECLKQLNLGLEERMQTQVGLLSGGQRQALTLLMATITPPKLLMLDEHTAALDPKTAMQVMKLTDTIIKRSKITTMMITHNLKQALAYGNKTIIMQEGKIVKVLEGKERAEMSIEKLITFYDIH